MSSKSVLVGNELTEDEEKELVEFLAKNSDIFAWSTSDLSGVSRSIVEHKLYVHPSAKPRKQKLRKMSEEKVAAAKAEVHRILDASFIREVDFTTWLANVVMVKMKNGKWRMCTDVSI